MKEWLEVRSVNVKGWLFAGNVLSGVLGTDGLTGSNSTLTLFVRPDDSVRLEASSDVMPAGLVRRSGKLGRLANARPPRGLRRRVADAADAPGLKSQQTPTAASRQLEEMASISVRMPANPAPRHPASLAFGLAATGPIESWALLVFHATEGLGPVEGAVALLNSTFSPNDDLRLRFVGWAVLPFLLVSLASFFLGQANDAPSVIGPLRRVGSGYVLFIAVLTSNRCRGSVGYVLRMASSSCRLTPLHRADVPKAASRPLRRRYVERT